MKKKKKKKNKIKKYKEFVKTKNEEEEYYNGTTMPYFVQNYPAKSKMLKNHSKE